MNKAVGAIILIIALAGGVMLWNSQSKPQINPETELEAEKEIEDNELEDVEENVAPMPAPSSPSASAPTAGGFTMMEVAKHNNAASCWSAINGSVYDLTNWIGKHPGGEEAIKSLCGKDGTPTFNNQHGGMQKQEAQLATFKIGVLVK